MKVARSMRFVNLDGECINWYTTGDKIECASLLVRINPTGMHMEKAYGRSFDNMKSNSTGMKSQATEVTTYEGSNTRRVTVLNAVNTAWANGRLQVYAACLH
ncbi:hypothetical protein Tco_1031303 [Tanacetum coccineum]|uniref:Uncharacterized protein n=1 Tax=Tanacetum coccineum TaxID=301880 RepID=A0ABQ5G8L7_9ASTR